MAATYEPIATTTFNNTVNTYTFSSIPGTYTDLKFVIACTTAANGAGFRLRLNGDTSALYSATYLGGDGSTASSLRRTGYTYIPLTELTTVTNSTNPVFWNIDIMSYTGSKNKTILAVTSGDLNGSGGIDNTVGLYRSTSAITSVTFYTGTGSNFSAGSATLYGIKAA